MCILLMNRNCINYPTKYNKAQSYVRSAINYSMLKEIYQPLIMSPVMELFVS